jgi:hypothetical protein
MGFDHYFGALSFFLKRFLKKVSIFESFLGSFFAFNLASFFASLATFLAEASISLSFLCFSLTNSFSSFAFAL